MRKIFTSGVWKFVIKSQEVTNIFSKMIFFQFKVERQISQNIVNMRISRKTIFCSKWLSDVAQYVYTAWDMRSLMAIQIRFEYARLNGCTDEWLVGFDEYSTNTDNCFHGELVHLCWLNGSEKLGYQTLFQLMFICLCWSSNSMS